MANYPTDAIAPTAAFPVTSTVKFSNTGSSTVAFNLATPISHVGEVAAFIDGVLQGTSGYSVSNSAATVTFLAAPNASNLTLQTLSLPAALVASSPVFTTVQQEYSNTAAVTVDSNSFVINSNTISFVFPAAATPTTTADFEVFVGGVYQNPDAFTFPSTVYGSQGIDIADNTATKLLLNFASNLTDDSDSSHTATFRHGTAAYTGSSLTFDGGDEYLFIPTHGDFDVNKSFTLDIWNKPDTGTSMTANQTLFARHETSTNFYELKYVGANSNVGFIVNEGGSITELYGGNANGGSNYHVAVSYESSTANLRLYVNNVKVAHTNYVPGVTTHSGNVVIGANNDLASNGEFFNGSIDFVRLAEGSRYRADGLQPVIDFSPNKQTGAPLGAIDENDTLSLRVFNFSADTITRFSSMADRKPDSGIESSRTFDVTTFVSQAGYEKRRLKSRRSKRNYDLTYSAITGVEKTAIETFYNARSGTFESFTFDLSHINESGTIVARFEGPLTISQTYSIGNRLIDNFYTVSFQLMEVFD